MASGGNGEQTLRIVMLGKTGAGKSSLGNALLGKTAPKSTDNQGRGTKSSGASKQPGEGFPVGRGMTSETVDCAWNFVSRNGTVLEVTDTPGLCDTHMPEEQIYKEVAKSVAVAEPGPNILIFTLRCDKRFTDEEFKAYMNIKELFSDEISRYLILVFNGLDVYEDEETIEGQRAVLAKEIEKYGGRMADMIREAGGRYFGMNNKAPRAEKEKQVREFTKMMQDLVKRNGKEAYYKSEVTEQINARVEALVRKEAKATGAAKTEATQKVKRDIIEEKVESGFFSSILNVFEGGVKDMCSVM